MKILSLMLLLLTFSKATAQQAFVGEYHDYFGHKIKLNADSTFRYTWQFDLGSSWTEGKWLERNERIYLEAIPVYDSLKYHDVERNVYIDTLVLSMDETSNLIAPNEFYSSLIAGGGQNRRKVPDRLYHRNGKLFHVDQKGRIIRKKQNGIMRNKKYPTYFIKNKNNLGTTTE